MRITKEWRLYTASTVISSHVCIVTFTLVHTFPIVHSTSSNESRLCISVIYFASILCQPYISMFNTPPFPEMYFGTAPPNGCNARFFNVVCPHRVSLYKCPPLWKRQPCLPPRRYTILSLNVVCNAVCDRLHVYVPSLCMCMHTTWKKLISAQEFLTFSSLYYYDGSGHCGLLALLLHHYFDGYRCIRQHQRVYGPWGVDYDLSYLPTPINVISLFTSLVPCSWLS